MFKRPLPSSAAPSGPAGGDLAGTYPNPTIPNLIPKTIFSAANELITSSANDTPALLAAPATDEVLTENAGSLDWRKLVNANIDAAAAVAITKLADVGAGNVLTSAGSGNVAKKPPGYEFGYDEITSPVTVSSTTESSGTSVIAAAAHVFDGEPVYAELFIPNISVGSAGFIIVSLFESTTQIARLIELSVQLTVTTVAASLLGRFKFTPSAASHTYTVTAYKNGAGTYTINAGAGGTAADPPAFLRFFKA